MQRYWNFSKESFEEVRYENIVKNMAHNKDIYIISDYLEYLTESKDILNQTKFRIKS